MATISGALSGSDEVPKPTPPTRERIGNYEIYGEIASGGMATVFVGVHVGALGFRRTVAIKRLRPELVEENISRTMLIDEARLAGKLTHPNVVPVLDVVASEGQLLLVMDLVRGASLARLAANAKAEPIKPSIAISIVRDVLLGLEAAHSLSVKGAPLEIVHRDVSPSNVLVENDGHARLIDFGIAKARARLHVTSMGELRGKLRYMAPEQLDGRGDHRVDVYAAAVILWELLVGRPLFDGPSPQEATRKILSERVERPSRLRADLPRALDAIVLRGLERDPAQRFASAREMRLAIESTTLTTSRSEIRSWVEATGRAELAHLDGLVQEAESENWADRSLLSVRTFLEQKTRASFSTKETASTAVTAVPRRTLAAHSSGGLASQRNVVIRAGIVSILLGGTIGWVVLHKAPAPAPAAADLGRAGARTLLRATVVLPQKSDFTASPSASESAPVPHAANELPTNPSATRPHGIPTSKTRTKQSAPSECRAAWVDEHGIKRYGAACL